MTNTNITPGAVVTGSYHGVDIIGRVVHMSDWSPASGVLVTVQLDGPITLHGSSRERVAVGMSALTLVEECRLETTAGVHGWRLTEAA
jgi:hypothetical protein